VSAYLARHDHAVRWAESNRRLIAHRFLTALGAEGERVLDVPHNTVTHAVIGGCGGWLHRKGAAPSDRGPIVIPGSRGALSYLVVPDGDREAHAWSLAHGAGRKWNRTDSLQRMKARYRVEALTQTDLGSRVICEDKQLLYEEAPPAYKDIDVVVKDLLDAGLLRIVATLRPVITYKVRKRP
jgi:release factor H-coupled RctB family protein